MERINEIWSASLLGRWLTAVCAWFSRQWAASGVVRWFGPPEGVEQGPQREQRVFQAVDPSAPGAVLAL